MKTKQFFILMMMVALGGLVWTACQKNDMPVAKTEDDRAEEKFFKSHTAAKPAATAVLQYAQRRNSQLPFVKQMMQKAGIPRWDKALIFENVSLPAGRGAVLGDSTTVVHIPFVPENDSMVKGSLMVRMSPNDTTMNLISAQDYASYGFGNPAPGSWNAHDVFNILTKLDNMVFGRTTYRITDGRLLGDSQHVNYKVTIDHTPPEPTLAELFVTLTVTNTQTVCIIAGTPGSGPGVCNTYVYITTYFIEIPEGGGTGGGGGGGTGGGPTGGGGSGGTGGPIVTGWEDWDDDPVVCNYTCDEASTILNGITAQQNNIVHYNDGPILPPDAEGIERKPKVVTWEFLTINFGWGMQANYSANFTGIVFRNNPTSPWKWQSITYANQIAQSSGVVPGCLVINVTGVVAGPVISADKLRAIASIAWVAQGKIGCGIDVQVKNLSGTIDGQNFLANH